MLFTNFSTSAAVAGALLIPGDAQIVFDPSQGKPKDRHRDRDV